MVVNQARSQLLLLKNLAIFNQFFYELFHLHLFYQQAFASNYERYFRFPLIKKLSLFGSVLSEGCMILLTFYCTI